MNLSIKRSLSHMSFFVALFMGIGLMSYAPSASAAGWSLNYFCMSACSQANTIWINMNAASTYAPGQQICVGWDAASDDMPLPGSGPTPFGRASINGGASATVFSGKVSQQTLRMGTSGNTCIGTAPSTPGSYRIVYTAGSGGYVSQPAQTEYFTVSAPACPSDSPYTETRAGPIATYCQAMGVTCGPGQTYVSSLSCHAAPGWNAYGSSCTAPSCGGCGCVSTPLPTVSLSASPNPAAVDGGTTLSWSSTGATSCSASGNWSGGLGTSGSQIQAMVGPSSRTFTITCSNAAGSASKSVTVTTLSPPSVSLSASPNPAAVDGGTTLSWSSSGANSCTGSGFQWGGGTSIPTSGSQIMGMIGRQDRTFTVTCTNGAGSTARSVTVTQYTTPTVSISASPNPPAIDGGTTLSWSSSGATSCTTSGGSWGSGSALPVSGSQIVAFVGPSTRTYNISCTGPGGTGSNSITMTPISYPVVNVTASPSTVSSGGSSIVSWSSQYASTCNSSWGGAVAPAGSYSTPGLFSAQTYTVWCNNYLGTRSGAVTVSVAAATPPVVNISASPSTVAYNGASTISWSASNASSCTASGDWSGAKATSGSYSTGALTSSKGYGLTCSGPGGSSMNSVSVNVTQPTPGVMLSFAAVSLPYGGSTTFTWSSSNASSCSVSPTGNVGVSGSGNTGPLYSDTTFTLVCNGPGGSNSASRLITVAAAPPVLVNGVCSPSHYGCGAGTTGSNVNGATTWTWMCNGSNGGSNASCSETKPVPVNGVCAATHSNCSSGTSGSASSDPSYWYWACSGLNGGTSDNSCSQMKPVPTETVTASPSSVAYGGTTVITWSSTGSTCNSSWTGGAVPTSGSYTTPALNTATTYTIWCNNAAGTTSGGATVSVGPAPAPVITFAASPSSVAYNTASTLTWSTSNATSCTAGGSWSGSKTLSGSASTGALTATSDFDLTCTGAGGTAAKSLTVNVTPPPAPSGLITSPSCAIAAGQSNCSGQVSWTSLNAPAPTIQHDGATFASQPSGVNVSRTLHYGSNVFTLQNSGVTFVTQAVPVDTAPGTYWDGTKAVPTPAPVVTVTPATNAIYQTQTTSFSWSTTNATVCNRYNGAALEQLNVGLSGTFTSPALMVTTKYEIRCANQLGTPAYPMGSGFHNVTVSPMPPMVSVSPLDQFLKVPFDTSLTHTFIVSNIGGGTLTGNVDITTNSNNTFSIVESNHSFSLGAGGQSIFHVIYAPKRSGQQAKGMMAAMGRLFAALPAETFNSGEITVTSNGGAPAKVTLYGTGITSVSGDDTVSMGNVPAGLTRSMGYRVMNNTIAPVTACISLTGSSLFTCDGSATCSVSVGANSNALVHFIFKPPTGQYGATSNAQASVGAIQLDGTCKKEYTASLSATAVKPVIQFQEK